MTTDQTAVERPKQSRDEVFDSELTFGDLGLDKRLLTAIEKRGYRHPTKVQAGLIPVALTGKDVLGQSKTGTGKTAAFGLPVLHLVDATQPFAALILAPTRELAVQVTHELRELGRFVDTKIVAVYGGLLALQHGARSRVILRKPRQRSPPVVDLTPPDHLTLRLQHANYVLPVPEVDPYRVRLLVIHKAVSLPG